jgi:hypothetical protein
MAADRLAAGTLATNEMATWLHSHGLNHGPLRKHLERLTNSLDRRQLGEALVAMAVAIEAAQPPEPQLVLTDSFDEVEGRDSLVAVHEVIASARTSLTLSGYSWGHWTAAGTTTRHPIFELAWKHLRVTPGLRLRLILHLNDKKNGTETELRTSMMHELHSRVWPWPERPDVFIDLARTPGQAGIMHAKVVIADRRNLIVTSANPSESAYTRSIEAGILLHQCRAADQMERHLDDLIARGVLVGLGWG